MMSGRCSSTLVVIVVVLQICKYTNSQSWSAPRPLRPLPDPNPISCGENNNFIVGWDTPDEDCSIACNSDTKFRTRISTIGPTIDDPNVYRQLDCTCTESGDRCLDSYIIWDTKLNNPSTSCNDYEYNITSLTKCEKFCNQIIPNSFFTEETENGIVCQCSDDIPICGISGGNTSNIFSRYSTSNLLLLLSSSSLMMMMVSNILL